MNDELLEYEGPHGTQALCHLLIFLCAEKPPVCVVGNFDGGLGSSTTNAIQVVATRVAERIHRDDFRLIEWYPHWSQSQHRFAEVTLTPAPATQLAHGQVLTGDPANPHTQEHTVVVRFVDPQSTPRSENELAKLLGEEAVRELRSYAGIPGDYTPERLFGSTGRRQAEAIRAHNRRVSDHLGAQISEWT